MQKNRLSTIHNSALEKSGATTLIILALFAGAAAFLVYLGSLDNAFVTWDDTHYIVENEHIRTLNWAFLKWAFTAVVQANYHPLTMISLALEYAAFGLNPWGYHLGNALWHSIDTALVFLLVVRLYGAPREALARKKALTTALITALLFALHPMHVESVAWASERKDVLSTFFFLLTLLSYLSYVSKNRKPLYYGLTLITFILALLSKPMVITLPVVLLIIDFYPLARFGSNIKKIIIEKIPFFALSILSAAVTLWAQRSGGAMQKLGYYSNVEAIVIPIRAYVFYLYKLIVPRGLTPLYPMPLDSGFFTLATLIPLALLIIITAITAQRALRGRRIYLAVWLYYIITLLPVIGIIKVGGQSAADRYTYITTIPIFILAGAYCASFWNDRTKTWRRNTVFAVAAVVLIIFAFLTTEQIKVWKDPLTFWSYVIKQYPERMLIPYHKRGIAYAKSGAFSLAEEDFSTGIRLSPSESLPYYNRSQVRASLGNYEGAIDDLSTLLQIDPGYTAVYYERGRIYERIGQYELAIKDIRETLRLQPDLAEAYIIINRLNKKIEEKALRDNNH